MKKAFFLGIALCLLSSFCLPTWAVPVSDLSEEVAAEASKEVSNDLSSQPSLAGERDESRKIPPPPAGGGGLKGRRGGSSTTAPSGLSAKIEALQEEIAQLRGQLEVQEHELKILKNNQQELAEDLDRRVVQVKSAADSNSDKLDSPPPPHPPYGHLLPQGGEGKAVEQAYNKAFDLIKNKKYTQATLSLKNFLKQYGDKKQEGEASKYVLNAYYWLGELYFLQGDFDQAAQQFKIIVKRFPGKPKVPDAMLKLGLISVNLGKKAEARQMFQDIKKRFPTSSAAHLAALELQKL